MNDYGLMGIPNDSDADESLFRLFNQEKRKMLIVIFALLCLSSGAIYSLYSMVVIQNDIITYS
jgi:hypothetical protein